MNIDKCKEFFEILFNKYQTGGYTTPDEFNLLAERAQIELFLERYGNPNTMTPNGSVKEGLEVGAIKSEMETFLAGTNINLTPLNFYSSAQLPSDYMEYSDARVDMTNSISPIVNLESDKVNARLLSLIVPPTLEFPISTIVGNEFRVYPKTILGCTLIYYRFPKSPTWGYTIGGGGLPVYDPTTSTDFELPETTHNEIIIKMLSFKGISLREQELINYSQMKDNQGV